MSRILHVETRGGASRESTLSRPVLHGFEPCCEADPAAVIDAILLPPRRGPH